MHLLLKNEVMSKRFIRIIGFILLLISSLFLIANFFSPHTVLNKTPYQVNTENLHKIASMNNSYLNASAVNYVHFPSVNVSKGKAIKIEWNSEVWLGGFIFSKQQFADFQSIVQNSSTTILTPTAKAWASLNGIDYDASGWGKDTEVTTNVTKSEQYDCVVTNAMYNEGAFAQISILEEYLIDYSIQTNYTVSAQKDNLYLYLGIAFIISAIFVMVSIPIKRLPSKQSLSDLNKVNCFLSRLL